MSQRNEVLEITLGMLLLVGMHIVALIGIYLLSLVFGRIFTNDTYASLSVLIIGICGFSIVQLLYVIPVVLLLKRQGKVARMKGVIIGVAITALLNGACFLLLAR